MPAMCDPLNSEITKDARTPPTRMFGLNLARTGSHHCFAPLLAVMLLEKAGAPRRKERTKCDTEMGQRHSLNALTIPRDTTSQRATAGTSVATVWNSHTHTHIYGDATHGTRADTAVRPEQNTAAGNSWAVSKPWFSPSITSEWATTSSTTIRPPPQTPRAETAAGAPRLRSGRMRPNAPAARTPRRTHPSFPAPPRV